MDLQARYPASFTQGMLVENVFRESASKLWRGISETSLVRNRQFHMDYDVRIDSRWYSVDVKSLKRLRRSGTQQSDYVCLELHGARADNKGWLLGGKADLIAFEQEHSFLLVWRERLVQALPFLVEVVHVERSDLAVRKLYARRDHELITWVEADILRTPWLLFKEIEKVV